MLKCLYFALSLVIKFNKSAKLITAILANDC